VAGREGERLTALIGGQHAAAVSQRQGQLELTYGDAWRSDPTATPVSLSMPLTSASHDDAVVRAFLWGLLPDNEDVLERWGREHHVSARNPFALLGHVGEDCAGAIQLVTTDRVDAALAGDGGIDWMDDSDVAGRLRGLRRDPTAWHLTTAGQFSLAGAQAKTALHFDARRQRWGVPWGAVPTTHILKPAVVGFDEHDLNEHLCLETARLLGLPTASSEIREFADERAIVVERYDRVRAADGSVRRVHQEDMCQALGLPPTAKYQNEGGPTPEQIVELLRRHVRPAPAASETVGGIVDALAFNWIIAGTDAHAKNYSVLLSGSQVRLAPLYDIASALPYDDMYLPKLRMAMRVGGEYRVEAISGRHWRRLADAVGLDPNALIDRIRELANRTPDALTAAVSTPPVRSLGSELPARLLDRIAIRARWCRQALDR
jgi:serine/threonine-protein kinase HipA